MFIPMKSIVPTRPKMVLACWGVDKHSSWMVCDVLVMVAVTVWWLSCSFVVVV